MDALQTQATYPIVWSMPFCGDRLFFDFVKKELELKVAKLTDMYVFETKKQSPSDTDELKMNFYSEFDCSEFCDICNSSQIISSPNHELAQS